jgi:hypothetical protein
LASPPAAIAVPRLRTRLEPSLKIAFALKEMLWPIEIEVVGARASTVIESRVWP